MIEAEVKVRADHEKIMQALKSRKDCSFEFVRTEHQKDIYFNAPDRDFAETDEALRIRWVNGAGEITYKGKRFDTLSKTRPEFNSPADEDSMTQILLALGYRISGKVEKTRNVFTFSDDTGRMIFCFDRIESLGDFLEIEIDLEDGSSGEEIRASTEKIFRILREFGISEKDSVRTSYLELVMNAEKGSHSDDP